MLKKNFCVHNLACIKAHISQDDLKFVTKAVQLKSSNLVLSALMEYKKDNFLLKIKKKSDGLAHFLLDYSPGASMNNLLARLEYSVVYCGVKTKSTPALSIFYENDKVRLKGTIKDNPLLMNFSFTAGKPEYGLGLDWTFALNTQKYTEYNFAV